MIDEVQKLIDQYLNWLRDKTHLRQLDDWVEITTPYLDRHNDYIQIYAKKHDGGFLLTDDGYTIEDLEQSGCKLQSHKRQELLKMTLNGFGVQMVKGELQVPASPNNFSLRKHNLMQAILAVNDMFYLAEAFIAPMFYEDVAAWLDLHNIRYTPKVKFTGKSGYDHLFDFVIPKSRQKPERILQTINRPSRDTAQSVAFAWIDTREVRPPQSKAFALLNDSEKTVLPSVEEALRNYDVTPVFWSKRENVREELAA
ncbi:MAG TPA: DUF1829 domain-containing protein [bacterium]|nr:DUF1829 domain-containing protein [bacterium]